MWGTQQPFNLFEVKLSFTRPPSGSISTTGQPCQLNNMFFICSLFFGRRVHVYRGLRRKQRRDDVSSCWQEFRRHIPSLLRALSHSDEKLRTWEWSFPNIQVPETNSFRLWKLMVGKLEDIISFWWGWVFFLGFMLVFGISPFPTGYLLLRATQLGNNSSLPRP